MNSGSDLLTVKAAPFGRGDLDDWFRRVASGKRRLFVFVHGFNTNFDEGVYRVAQIVHDSEMNAAPVLFNWPSRGRPSAIFMTRPERPTQAMRWPMYWNVPRATPTSPT
jgi:esterase/lipase superfamily enzyme